MTDCCHFEAAEVKRRLHLIYSLQDLLEVGPGDKALDQGDMRCVFLIELRFIRALLPWSLDIYHDLYVYQP